MSIHRATALLKCLEALDLVAFLLMGQEVKMALYHLDQTVQWPGHIGT